MAYVVFEEIIDCRLNFARPLAEAEVTLIYNRIESEIIQSCNKMQHSKAKQDDHQIIDGQIESFEKADFAKKEAGTDNVVKILSLVSAAYYIVRGVLIDVGMVLYLGIFILVALSMIWFPETYQSFGFRFISTSSTADGQGESSVPLIKLTGWVFLFLIGFILFFINNFLK
jgi:hypothetical protein